MYMRDMGKITKTVIIIAVSIILLAALIGFSSAGKTHIATGYVWNSPQGYPALGAMVTTYISARPTELLKTYVHDDNAWSVNVGDFPTSWSEGDTVTVIVSSEWGNNSTSVVLTNAFADTAPEITIEGKPADYPGIIDMVNINANTTRYAMDLMVMAINAINSLSTADKDNMYDRIWSAFYWKTNLSTLKLSYVLGDYKSTTQVLMNYTADNGSTLVGTSGASGVSYIMRYASAAGDEYLEDKMNYTLKSLDVFIPLAGDMLNVYNNNFMGSPPDIATIAEEAENRTRMVIQTYELLTMASKAVSSSPAQDSGYNALFSLVQWSAPSAPRYLKVLVDPDKLRDNTSYTVNILLDNLRDVIGPPNATYTGLTYTMRINIDNTPQSVKEERIEKMMEFLKEFAPLLGGMMSKSWEIMGSSTFTEYFDEMDDSTGAAWTINTGSSNWKVRGEKYNISGTAGSGYESTIIGVSVSDVVIDVDARINSITGGSESDWIGMAVRKSSASDRYDDSGYTVLLRNDSRLELRKAGNTLLDNVTIPDFDTSDWFTLTVELSGSDIKVYVDRILYLESNDSTYTSGYISLVSDVKDADFDELSITEINSRTMFYDTFTNPDGDARKWCNVSASGGCWISSNELTCEDGTGEIDVDFERSFYPTRTIEARMKTTTVGAGSNRNVGWIYPKYVNTSDSVYGLLQDGGVVELKINSSVAVVKNVNHTASSSLDPREWHTYRFDIVDSSNGPRVKMYIDDILYHNVGVDEGTAAIQGTMRVSAHGGSTVVYDNVEFKEFKSSMDPKIVTFLISWGETRSYLLDLLTLIFDTARDYQNKNVIYDDMLGLVYNSLAYMNSEYLSIMTDQKRTETQDAMDAIADEMPNILGSPDATSGLNYFAKYTYQINKTKQKEVYESVFQYTEKFILTFSEVMDRYPEVFGWA